MVLDSPMTGEVFRAYVEQVLTPDISPGDVVVLDNLAAHKVAGIQGAIQAVGVHLLYLTPYSPDECQAWSNQSGSKPILEFRPPSVSGRDALE